MTANGTFTSADTLQGLPNVQHIEISKPIDSTPANYDCFRFVKVKN